MASDKDKDRSLNGYSDREGTGGGPGGPAGTGRNTNTNTGNQGGDREGTGGGPGAPAGTGRNSGTNTAGREPSRGGGTATGRATTGTPGSSPGGGWSTQGGGTATPTPTRSVSPVGTIGAGLSAPAPSRGLGPALSTTPSLTAPSFRSDLGLRPDALVRSTPTGFSSAFRPDLGLRPDLNPAVAANAALQSALAMTRAKEHKPGTDPYSPTLYSTVFGSGVVPGLTNMTLRQVMAYQKTMPRSRAVGAYQIKDLPWAASLAGISLDDKFTIAVQDRLATALAARRIGLATDKKTGAIDTQKAAVQIANEWTSYALPATGKSAVPKNNKARGGPEDTLTAVQNFVTAFASGATPAAATSATAAPANVPIPTARPTFANKYLGAGRPTGVAPVSANLAPTPAATSPAAQAILNDLAARDAALFGVGAGVSGVTPRSAGVNYAGSTPPSQALAPGPVGAGFSSAISPQQQAAGYVPGSPTGPRGAQYSSLNPAQMSNSDDPIYGPTNASLTVPTGASLTRLDAPGLATRFGNNDDIQLALRYGVNPTGPPAASLTNRTVAQGLAQAPRNRNLPTAGATVAQGLANIAPNPTMEVPPARPEQQYDALAFGALTFQGKPISIEKFQQQKPRALQRLSDFAKLQVAAGVPVTNLNSMDRTPQHNFDVGGTSTSEHLTTTGVGAIDVDGSNLTDEQLTQTVVNLRAAGWNRIGAYGGSRAVHADAKDVPAFSGYDVHPMFNKTVKNMGSKDVPGWFREGLTRGIDRTEVASILSGAAAPGPATTAAATAPGATTAPAGTGPAVGPQGDVTPDKVEGKFPEEPMLDWQKNAAAATKFVTGTFGGTIGLGINLLDVGIELATGRGAIDRFWAATDNGTGGGGSYRGLTGDTASASGRDRVTTPPTPPKPPTPTPTPAVKPIATVNNVVDKYIEDKTWRPTPAQRWNYEDDRYSEYA